MWSTFTAKYRKGSQDKAELVSKARPAAEAAAAGGHKVRFDSVGEDERPSSQGRRRLRGRNIVHHSDVEVASSVAAASVVSDNTHLYRRSRSAHTLDNKSTKKYLLKSKGRTLDDVSSKMKLIESSLGLDTGSRTDLQDINGVILELEGEIKVKENQISELYQQLSSQNYPRDDSTKIEQKLGLLETQMNAKILQMQNKKAKLFKLKKNTDQSGGGGAAAAGPARSQSLSSLYDLVTGAGQEETHLVTATVTYDSLGSTAVAGAGAGAGLLVTADLPGPGGLRQGDRFLSINERNVFNIGAEEWAHLRVAVAFPVEAVVVRQRRPRPGPGSAAPGQQFCSPDISGIKEDIAIIQSTLEQKLSEGRTVSSELERARREKRSLAQENTRLQHRIAYLEDQTTELQEGLRQVRDSLSRTLNTTDIIQVITRLDVASESSGVGSCAASEGSNSPPLVQQTPAPSVYGCGEGGVETDNDFISRLLVGSSSGSGGDMAAAKTRK